jgi:hypothetical protein
MIYTVGTNELLTSTAMSVAPGGEKLFELDIDCRADYSVTAAIDNPDVEVFAKAAPGDTFTDIVAGALDLTPYAGTRRTIFFKTAADVAADPDTDILQIIVSR